MVRLKSFNVCFLGRTGVGKTTLMNELYGVRFPTDPLVSCTKELYTVTKMGECPDGYECITIYDTPGIGEFSSNDQYQYFYEEAVANADCIILVLTLDRTDAPSQRLLITLKELIKPDVKFIVAINHIDSTSTTSGKSYVSWDDETNTPTDACFNLIQDRTRIVQERFNKILSITDVVPVCGLRKYGMNILKQDITE